MAIFVGRVPVGSYLSPLNQDWDDNQIVAIRWTKELGKRLAHDHPEIADLYRQKEPFLTCLEIAAIFIPEISTQHPKVAAKSVVYALDQLLTSEERVALTYDHRRNSLVTRIDFSSPEWRVHCQQAWENRMALHPAPVEQLIRGRGQVPYSKEEKERLLQLRQNESFTHKNGQPNYKLIADQLNQEFHEGIPVRTQIKVRNWSKDHFRKLRQGGWRCQNSEGGNPTVAEESNARKAFWPEAMEVGKGIVDVEGVQYPFTIVNRDQASGLPYFAGMPKGDTDLLFVSDQLFQKSSSWAQAVLFHEVYCNHLWTDIPQPDRCVRAMVQELDHVTQDEWQDYLIMRITFFEALVGNPTYVPTGASEFRTQIEHVLNWAKQKLKMLRKV